MGHRRTNGLSSRTGIDWRLAKNGRVVVQRIRIVKRVLIVGVRIVWLMMIVVDVRQTAVLVVVLLVAIVRVSLVCLWLIEQTVVRLG